MGNVRIRLISGLVDQARRAGAVIASGLASCFAGSALAGEPGMIEVNTKLPRKTMVAGSPRTYTMKVEVDTTGVPGAQIKSADWKIWVPTMDLEQVSAEKASGPEDFFMVLQ